MKLSRARPEANPGRGRTGLRRPVAADEFAVGHQSDHGGDPRVALYHGVGPVDGRHHGPAEDLRGNVSMNLSKLVEWGLVRRVHQRGDRRDYYESLSDVWEMFTLVAAQRKRREIDPIVNTLRACREQLSPETLGAAAEDDAAAERRRRVGELLSFLTLMDGLAQRFFDSRRGLREAVDLLAKPGERGG